MSSPVPQSLVLLNAWTMSQDTVSPRIDLLNYQNGALTAAWSGNDAVDATLVLQVSSDNVNWNNIGTAIDDLGSVTINTANDNQQWDIQPFGPYYVRAIFSHGSNTTGSLNLTWNGFIKAPGS